MPVQALPRARIGLVGLESPSVSTVALSVTRPAGYGLSASERREGWPELNDVVVREVALDGSAFRLEFPPASNCIHRFLWQKTPPPPAWFVFRFSDAPDQEYVVWSHRGRSLYYVRDSGWNEIPEEQAAWRLHVGPYQPEGPEGRDRLWLLQVRVERQRPPTRHEADGGATATA